MSPAVATPPPGPSRNEEITAFFIAHRNELRGYLIRVSGCPEHEADDITQDAFLAVREQWNHVRDYEKPKAYLYKVAVSRFFRLRGQQVSKYLQGDPEPLLAAFPDPADAFAAADRNRNDASTWSGSDWSGIRSATSLTTRDRSADATSNTLKKLLLIGREHAQAGGPVATDRSSVTAATPGTAASSGSGPWGSTSAS